MTEVFLQRAGPLGGLLGLVALLIVLRYRHSKVSKHVKDLAAVGRRLDDEQYDFDEFDIIVIGGG